jgi:hypothetical protein
VYFRYCQRCKKKTKTHQTFVLSATETTNK